jgi:hypothetical protein
MKNSIFCHCERSAAIQLSKAGIKTTKEFIKQHATIKHINKKTVLYIIMIFFIMARDDKIGVFWFWIASSCFASLAVLAMTEEVNYCILSLYVLAL